MFRFVCGAIVLMASIQFAYSQSVSRPNYQLLWKITGKGLKKPSYLFGTMHVRDNKAFDFSDSVLVALMRTEAFASEVHPDSMVNSIMSTFLDGDKKEDHFQEHLSDEAYSELDSLMKLRMGVPLSKFKSPSQAGFFLLQQFEKKDKPTFLDIWLFNIARNDGKTVFGLEDIDDQYAILEMDMPGQIAKMQEYLRNEKSETKDYYERMFATYHSGDIEKIRAMSVEGCSPALYEHLVRKRNIQMTDRIAKEIPMHSTFIAVGAAHLGGEEGIVHLLRQRGFKVSAVNATFTGLAAKFDPAKAISKWSTFTQSEGGYTIELPTKPVVYNVPNTPMDFQVSFDAGAFSVYMTTHFPISGEYAKRHDEMLETMIQNFSQRGEIRSKKIIDVNGRKAREVEVEVDGQLFILQLIAGDKMLYMLMAAAMDGVSVDESSARFFSSFKMTDLDAVSSWEEYVNEPGAYSVRMPGKVSTQFVTPEDPQTGKKYKFYISFASDNEAGVGYVVRYNDFIPGYVSQDDSLYLHTTLANMVGNMGGTNEKTTKKNYQGFPALQFEFDARNNVKAEGFMTLRGNRFYIVLTTRVAGEKSEKIDAFLKSFQFKPYKKTTGRLLDFPDGARMKVPVGFESDSALTNAGDGGKNYAFLDVNSGVSFLLLKEKQTRFAEAKDTARYFNNIKESLETPTTRVIKEQSFVNGKTVGHDFWIRADATNATRRVRILLSGDQLASLWMYLPDDYEQSNFPEEVLQSFSLNVNTKWNLFADKTDDLLKTLTSTDTASFEEARLAIGAHNFTKDDLPKIYELLRKPQRDDGKRFGSVRQNLFEVLKDVNDNTTSPFIKSVYNSLPDTTSLRDNALSVLTNLKTKEDMRAMVEIIRGDTSRKFIAYQIIRPFYDSLALANDVLVDLLDLQDRFTEKRNLIELTKMAIDSNVLTTPVREKVILQSLAIAKRIANEPQVGEEDSRYYDQQNTQWRAAKLLTSLPFTADVKEVMLKLHQLKDRDIMAITAIHLLKNKVEVPAADLDALGSDRSYRMQVYRDLKEIGQAQRLNKKYRTPSSLAEGRVQEYLEYLEEWPDTLVMHSVKQIQFEGQKTQLFVFKYRYDGSEEWYLAATGPFSEKPKKELPEGTLIATFYEQLSSEEEINTLLRAFLEENRAALLVK